MKTIFLDRNAVILIRKYLGGSRSSGERLDRLKKLDKDSHFISPMLAAIEGQRGRRETAQEMLSTIREESETIAKFFKTAKTDHEFFTRDGELFAETFANHREHGFDGYLSYVKGVGGHLYQPVSEANRAKVEQALIDLATQCSVPLQHPVFVASIATLYGSSPARKILKPKPSYESAEAQESAAYNTVNDLLTISRIMMILAETPRKELSSVEYKYFTFDAGLSFFINAALVTYVRAIPTGGVAVSGGWSRKLFPDASDLQWKHINEILSGAA